MFKLRHLAVDLTPLRDHRDFRLLWTGQLVSLVGRQMTFVAIPFQIYLLSGSPLLLGLLGLFKFVPLLLLSQVGGVAADLVDRRRLMLVTQLALALAVGVLAVVTFSGNTSVLFLLVMAGVISGISSVDQPARAATTPRLVPASQLSSALALNFSLFQVTAVIGPLVAGGLLQAFGGTAGLTVHLGAGLHLPGGPRLAAGYAYLADCLSYAGSVTALLLMSPQPPSDEHREPPLRALGSGIRFALSQRVLLGTFSMDLNAMIFGLPQALYPALARDVFHVGPSALGAMYAAPGLGAFAGSMLTGFVGRMRHPGRAVAVAVCAWGAAIAAFGLATFSLAVALALLAVAAACDAISAVARGTILQTVTPDHLRGRLSAANWMVVVGGPNLGDLESGSVASLTSPQFSVISGGVLALAGALVTLAALPELWRYRRDS
ncbi:MAG: MFS transporter [Candidatus Dormibacteria bacterium]